MTTIHSPHIQLSNNILSIIQHGFAVTDASLIKLSRSDQVLRLLVRFPALNSLSM